MENKYKLSEVIIFVVQTQNDEDDEENYDPTVHKELLNVWYYSSLF